MTTTKATTTTRPKQQRPKQQRPKQQRRRRRPKQRRRRRPKQQRPKQQRRRRPKQQRRRQRTTNDERCRSAEVPNERLRTNEGAPKDALKPSSSPSTGFTFENCCLAFVTVEGFIIRGNCSFVHSFVRSFVRLLARRPHSQSVPHSTPTAAVDLYLVESCTALSFVF